MHVKYLSKEIDVPDDLVERVLSLLDECIELCDGEPSIETSLPLLIPEQANCIKLLETFGAVHALDDEAAKNQDIHGRKIPILISLSRARLAKNLLISAKEKGITRQTTIEYRPQSGTGKVAGKKFTFKLGSKEYLLFTEMYKNINKAVPKERIQKLFGFSDMEVSTETAKLVHEMRKKTGLSNYEIVQNDSSVILHSSKPESINTI